MGVFDCSPKYVADINEGWQNSREDVIESAKGDKLSNVVGFYGKAR
tara:strand:+ start:3664 stop:3801 length:138 start_codon:yes stop_codon:yes gene_type:complete